MGEPVMCPECGWTGTEQDLDATGDVHQCPICDTDVEIVD